MTGAPNPTPAAQTDRSARQRAAANWCAAVFGPEHAHSVPQRAVRFFEEAVEAVQAAGADRLMLHRLIDYVFERPVGDLGQEIGGAGVTLMVLAQAAGIDADQAEAVEIARVLAAPPARYVARNAAKNAAGFDVLGTVRDA